MRLLADMHISPRTVEFLRTLGHDVVRVSEILPPQASDETIVSRADEHRRIILTTSIHGAPARSAALLFLPTINWGSTAACQCMKWWRYSHC